MTGPRTVLEIARRAGARSVARRLAYEAKRASGLLDRRMRRVDGWDAWRLERIAPAATAEALLRSRRAGERPFLFGVDRERHAAALRRVLGEEGEAAVRREAERVVAGTLPYFGRLRVEAGFPPDWHADALTGARVSPERPWTTLRFHDPEVGDLKLVLEPSRFLLVHPLARAYRLSGDERWAEAFWTAVESWAEASPPMRGPLWVCGQESALRMLAWTFALHAFLDADATTVPRAARLVSMIAAHGWRVEQTLGYARSQRNNHLLSEAVGLWTAGVMFPELSRARRWRRRGAELFAEAVLDQFDLDGVYAQHSFNYQRMALHLCVWMLALGRRHGREWDEAIRDRVAAAADLLGRVADAASGRVPNHGANDGALILALSNEGFDDYRPALQTAARTLGRDAPFPAGPWDEESAWLLGADAPPGDAERSRLPGAAAAGAAPAPDAHPPAGTDGRAAGGFVVLGDADARAVVRCARYGRGPSQADQLHVDLRWRGESLALDAGTYLYNGEPPWDNGLARTAAHNTVTVDGRDQMTRAGRFRWTRWAQAAVRHRRVDEEGRIDYVEAEHDGYAGRGVVHRRAVQRLHGLGWLVVDDVRGGGVHHASLHWLVPDFPFEGEGANPFLASFGAPFGAVRWAIACSAAGSRAYTVRGGVSSARPVAPVDAAFDAIRGWASPTYAERVPARSLVCDARGEAPIRFVTVVLTGAAECVALDPATAVEVRGEDGARVRAELGAAAADAEASRPIVRRVRRRGERVPA